MKKYTLSETETKVWNGHTLHKVVYTKEWKRKHAYEDIEGGWIESEENLSQDGDARVFGNACVFGNARVYDDAYVYGDACVYDDACIYDEACIYGDACVYGDASVCGDACVSQGKTTSMRIWTTGQWHEYQYRKAELQAKWDKDDE